MSSNRYDSTSEPEHSPDGIRLLALVLSRAIEISRENESAGLNGGTMQILEQALDEQVASPDEIVRVWAVMQLGTFAAKKIVKRKHYARFAGREEPHSQQPGDSAFRNQS